MSIPNRKYYKNRGLIVAAILIVVGGVFAQDFFAKKVVIVSEAPVNIKGANGMVVYGENRAMGEKLATSDKLVYESGVVLNDRRGANAVYIKWKQDGDNGSVETDIRTHNGKQWSDWYHATVDPSERPDHATSVESEGFLVSDNIQKVQYKLIVEAGVSKTSPEVDLDSVEMQTIDASRGPSLSHKTILDNILAYVGLGATASARLDGPRIISRAEWGSPEPDSSEWTPEYAPLNRVVIHHTAIVPGSDSAAAVRAIWQYHAKTQGWGDIGYNYLVDQNGNIFQGRYYDKQYAEENNVDVVGGHVYGNNVGTSGIAALGDFEKTGPTTSLVHSMGEVAAYKGGPYGLNPAEGTTYGGNLLGHRDLLSTSCPGKNLYANIQTIRNVANALFPRYHVPDYSWQYANQYSYTDPDRTNQINPSNEYVLPGQKLYLTVQAVNKGTKPWYPDGDTPVRLGSSNPQDRSSSFSNDDWLASNRAASLVESVVKPGQTGSFKFSVSVPNNQNLAEWNPKEYFTPLVEGKTWMNNPGLYWQFKIARPYAWQYITQSSYIDAAHTQPINLNTTSVEEDQEIHLSVEARNVGSSTWSASGPNPIRLGTSNPQDRPSIMCNLTWLNCVRATSIKNAVNPGESGLFDFKIITPKNNTATEQVYKEYFNPLAEGVVWMNNPGLYWQIKVKP